MTVVLLDDLFTDATLTAAIDAGQVRRSLHPDQPLAILNYTDQANSAGGWSEVTSLCRGLIYRTDTREVVARPFRKFFNHGQPGASSIALDAPVRVTDKLDGSMGVLYPLPSGGWAVATRGSFTSTQAVHATELLRRRYPTFTPEPAHTVLFEIVYPGNRIVVDYGDVDDLLLLGAVHTRSGEVIDLADVRGWTGPAATVFTAPTFADALALPPRPNAEGIVVRCLRSDAMLKIKQADYLALHRIVSGLNTRRVWQHLVDGAPLDELVTPLPDEFHPWVRGVAAHLTDEVERADRRLRAEFAALAANLPDGWGRREFAAAVREHPDAWAMFALLDDRPIAEKLLYRLKPEELVGPSGWVTTDPVA